MADLPPYRDTSEDTDVGRDHGTTTRTPRWVKVFGIAALVLVLLVVVMLIFGGGSHGPSRHTPPSGRHPNAPIAGTLVANEAIRSVEATVRVGTTFEPLRANVLPRETIGFAANGTDQVVQHDEQFTRNRLALGGTA